MDANLDNSGRLWDLPLRVDKMDELSEESFFVEKFLMELSKRN